MPRFTFSPNQQSWAMPLTGLNDVSPGSTRSAAMGTGQFRFTPTPIHVAGGAAGGEGGSALSPSEVPNSIPGQVIPAGPAGSGLGLSGDGILTESTPSPSAGDTGPFGFSSSITRQAIGTEGSIMPGASSGGGGAAPASSSPRFSIVGGSALGAPSEPGGATSTPAGAESGESAPGGAGVVGDVQQALDRVKQLKTLYDQATDPESFYNNQVVPFFKDTFGITPDNPQASWTPEQQDAYQTFRGGERADLTPTQAASTDLSSLAPAPTALNGTSSTTGFAPLTPGGIDASLKGGAPTVPLQPGAVMGLGDLAVTSAPATVGGTSASTGFAPFTGPGLANALQGGGAPSVGAPAGASVGTDIVSNGLAALAPGAGADAITSYLGGAGGVLAGGAEGLASAGAGALANAAPSALSGVGFGLITSIPSIWEGINGYFQGVQTAKAKLGETEGIRKDFPAAWNTFTGANATNALLDTVGTQPADQQQQTLQKILNDSWAQVAASGPVSQFISTQGGRQTAPGSVQVPATDVTGLEAQSPTLMMNAATSYLVSRDALAARGATMDQNYQLERGVPIANGLARWGGLNDVTFLQAGSTGGEPNNNGRTYTLTPEEQAGLDTPGLVTQTLVGLFTKLNPGFAQTQLGQRLAQVQGVIGQPNPATLKNLGPPDQGADITSIYAGNTASGGGGD